MRHGTIVSRHDDAKTFRFDLFVVGITPRSYKCSLFRWVDHDVIQSDMTSNDCVTQSFSKIGVVTCGTAKVIQSAGIWPEPGFTNDDRLYAGDNRRRAGRYTHDKNVMTSSMQRTERTNRVMIS